MFFGAIYLKKSNVNPFPSHFKLQSFP
ncbi:MAG: hypothetical protein RL204_1954, partial [Bacteroidota bacterium]